MAVLSGFEGVWERGLAILASALRLTVAESVKISVTL
jgi:hypothetical protein